MIHNFRGRHQNVNKSDEKQPMSSKLQKSNYSTLLLENFVKSFDVTKKVSLSLSKMKRNKLMILQINSSQALECDYISRKLNLNSLYIKANV